MESDPNYLAELPEREATGEKARIYAEMRRLGAVPMVALIFRHLATLPGGLEWAWGAIGPLWKSGRVQEAAWKIAEETPFEPLAPFPPEGLEEVRTVVRAYNLANPVNLLTVTSLSRVLAGAEATVPLEARAWTPPVAPGPLPPMVAPSELSPEVRALLDLVAAPGSDGGPRVVQSLYRHFAHRPQFLALLVASLLPRFRDGSIDRGVLAIHAAMDRAADALVPALAAPPAPDPGIGIAFERFRLVIPQMIVVGALILSATSRSER